MLRSIPFFILSFFTVTLFAQVVDVPAPMTVSVPEEAKKFIAAGYEPLDYKTGDINNDKRTDAILLLKRPGEDSLYEEEMLRPLIVLIRQADGKLKQVARNDHAIMCRQCGGVFGDPYEGMMLYPGGFSLNFYGGSSWRWGYEYKFSYKPLKKNWYLVKETETSFQSGDPEATMKTSTILENELGEVSISAFNADPEYKEMSWKVISLKTYFYDDPKLGSKPRKAYLVKGNVAMGVRVLKNFVLLSYTNDKDEITVGYTLRKDLMQIK